MTWTSPQRESWERPTMPCCKRMLWYHFSLRLVLVMQWVWKSSYPEVILVVTVGVCTRSQTALSDMYVREHVERVPRMRDQNMAVWLLDIFVYSEHVQSLYTYGDVKFGPCSCSRVSKLAWYLAWCHVRCQLHEHVWEAICQLWHRGGCLGYSVFMSVDGHDGRSGWQGKGDGRRGWCVMGNTHWMRDA